MSIARNFRARDNMREIKLFRRRQICLAYACLLVALLNPALGLAADKISLYYNERVPYLETQENGNVAGLTATPAKLAFQRAGIEFEWQKASVNMLLVTIKENQKKACLVGWYKNPDREKLGKFTHSIYEGRQVVAIGLRNNSKLLKQQTIKDLLQNREVALLVKEGYSYGRILDQLIAQNNPRVGVATGENTNMLSMLVYKRADYFFIGEDEVFELINRSEFKQNDFTIIRFSDAIDEDPRYLWCTKQVPDEIISKLNVEIDRAKTKR